MNEFKKKALSRCRNFLMYTRSYSVRSQGQRILSSRTGQHPWPSATNSMAATSQRTTHRQTQTARQTADVLTTVETMYIKARCFASVINYWPT